MATPMEVTTLETLTAQPDKQAQGSTTDMPESEKPRKEFKDERSDPIKLIMARGLPTKVYNVTVLNEETGEEEVQQVRKDMPPQGLVLSGAHVQLVAMTLARFQGQIQILQGIIGEYQQMLQEEEKEGLDSEEE